MLRTVLVVSLIFALSDFSKAERRDPRIIDLSKDNRGLIKADPKPKERSIATRSIRARMTKTRMQIKANNDYEMLRKRKLARQAKQGLKFIEKVLVGSRAIQLNKQKRIVKVDSSQVKNVRNVLSTRMSYEFGKDTDTPCIQAVDFVLRAGELSKKVRDQRRKHPGKDNHAKGNGKYLNNKKR